MKYETITFETIFSALRRQVKVFSLCVLVFAVVGVVAGLLFCEESAAPAGGHADALQTVDLSSVSRDAVYFQTASDALKLGISNAQTYLSILFAESSLSDEQKSAVNAFTQELNGLSAERMTFISRRMSTDRVYVLPEHLAEEIQYYHALIKEMEGNLIMAQESAEILKSIEAPRALGEASEAAYARLMEEASRVGEYTRNLRDYEMKLNAMENTPLEIQQLSSEMDSYMKETETELNQMISKLNELADTIARENALIFTVTYDVKQVAAVATTHTHTAVSETESAVIIALFTTLTGVCCGMFLAVVKEARSRKREPGVSDTLDTPNA